MTSTGDAWRAKVLDQFNYTDAELEALRLAGEALERAELAESAIQEHGVLIEGLHGPKVNPAVAVKRDAEATFLRFCRALGILERVDADADA